jgi:hypothetical protein
MVPVHRMDLIFNHTFRFVELSQFMVAKNDLAISQIAIKAWVVTMKTFIGA